MAPYNHTPFQQRRDLEVLSDQLLQMRTHLSNLESETSALGRAEYNQSRLGEYNIMLARQKVMGGEIARLKGIFEEKEEILEEELQAAFERRLEIERKVERKRVKRAEKEGGEEKGKGNGFLKRLEGLFRGR